MLKSSQEAAQSPLVDSKDREYWEHCCLSRLKEENCTDSSSLESLAGYLQDVAIDAAKEISDRLKLSPNSKLHYSEENVRAIALTLAQPALVLKNLAFFSNSSLENSARTVLVNLIKKQIVRELNSSIISEDTDIEILRNTNISQLKEALYTSGFSSEETINLYCLAWLAFRELSEEFFPRTNSVGFSASSPLNQEQLCQIAQRYNQLLFRLESPTLLPVNSQSLSDMLSVCALAVRDTNSQK